MSEKPAAKPNYWLMKSEPGEFSIDDLKREKRAMWDGIRNYQVRNMLREDFKKGDIALFYHSNAKEIGVVGEMEVAREAYPDPTQFDPKNKHFDAKSRPENPRWLCMDVRFKRKFPRTVTLAEMKGEKTLLGLEILKRGNRLSVVLVTPRQYEKIVSMATT